MTLRTALNTQADACRSMGSIFTGQLLTCLAENIDDTTSIGARLLSWEGDIGPTGQSVPLRIAGALHALKIGGFDPLVQTYPPANVDDYTLWTAVLRAFSDHSDDLHAWLDNPPQTNEVRRSGVLLGAAALATDLTKLPLRLIELGASAGLNLSFDQYSVSTPAGSIGAPNPVLELTPEWRGEVPTTAAINVVHRSGCDLAPIDPQSEEGKLKLLAYLWADQPERRRNTLAAINVAGTKVEPANALDFLDHALVNTPGQTRFLFHTVAWQYFPPDVQTAAQRKIETAGALSDKQSPLVWFSMEAGGDLSGAQLRMRMWPGDISLDLGRADFHGRWIDWKNPEEAQL